MSGLTIALRDGSRVDWDSCLSVGRAAQAMYDKEQWWALWALAKKSQKASFAIHKFSGAQSILKQYNLIDENNNVTKVVKQIVLNHIKEKNGELVVDIPDESGDIQRVKFPITL